MATPQRLSRDDLDKIVIAAPWDTVAPNTFIEWQPLLGEAPKSV
jgi:hypothetical protein